MSASFVHTNRFGARLYSARYSSMAAIRVWTLVKVPRRPPPMRRVFTFPVTLLLLLVYSPLQASTDEPTCIVHVEGEPTGAINDFHDLPGGLLLVAADGLFRYDGSRVVHVGGDPTGGVDA